LIEERRTSPAFIEGFFASHPLEEDRIRATQGEIDAIDPSQLNGLRSSDANYDAFRQRLRALPPSPLVRQ
jgi:hypothetical protein